MPVPRRTSRHCEAVETHGQEVRLLVLVLDQVTADGLIEPHEGQLLDRHVSQLLATYQPLPAEASVIDTGVRIIGAMTNTMSITGWVERLLREGAEDEEGLIEVGLLEPVAV